MVKLRQTFQTKPDPFGFITDLDVSCNYDPEQDSIDNVEVYIYTRRFKSTINITSIFSITPFAEVVDSINWPAIYRESQHNKAA